MKLSPNPPAKGGRYFTQREDADRFYKDMVNLSNPQPTEGQPGEVGYAFEMGVDQPKKVTGGEHDSKWFVGLTVKEDE